MNINERYTELTGNKTSGLTIDVNAFIPRPNETDYKRGYITRYFVQRVNDKHAPIYEVSATELGRVVQSVMYKTVTLRWRISGPVNIVYDNNGKVIDKGVKQSNEISISLETDKIPNLKLYLPNTIQFHRKK